MAERFYAEIDINGDNKGALAAIKAVDAALSDLNRKDITSNIAVKGRKDLENIREGVREASKEFSKLHQNAERFKKSGVSSSELNKSLGDITTARRNIATELDKINTALNTGAKGSYGRALKEFRDNLKVMDNQLSQMASRASRASSGMENAFKNAEKGAAGAAKATDRLNRAFEGTSKSAADFRRELRAANPELDSYIKKAASLQGNLARHRRVEPDRRDGDWQIREVQYLNDIADNRNRAAQIVETAAKDQNKLTDATRKQTAAIDESNAALERDIRLRRDKAALKSADVWNRESVAIRQAGEQLDRTNRARYDAIQATDAHARALRDYGEADARTVAAGERAVQATQARRDAERDLLEYRNRGTAAIQARSEAVNRQIADQQRLGNEIRANQQMAERHARLLDRYRHQEAVPGPIGEREAADMFRRTALAELAEAERVNAAATADSADAMRARNAAVREFGERSSQAVSAQARLNQAMQTQIGTSAAYRYAMHQAAEAQQAFNNANMFTGNARRYAMYDAAQYNAMLGLASMAPLIGGGVAFGMLESSFSDVQRTAQIDYGGTLPSGATALNLLGPDTASNRLFGDLLGLGRRIPVGYGDIFDMAGKAGSIGAEGPAQVRSLVEAVSMFNAVSDVANAADTMETFGQMGNLLRSSDYMGMASAIVHTGAAAAATDDQILSVAKELSMAMASTNASEADVIGLSAALASLSIPPERARSVFLDLTTTMAKGLGEVTPEIETMSNLLGVSTKEVQDLWKSNPVGLIQDMAGAMAGLDETQMVSVLTQLGLDGKRAMPTFQALAANIRDTADGADVLTNSLNAAHEGMENPEILMDAVANKSDDLAGKLQFLVNAVVDFAATLGGLNAGPLGFVLDGLTNMLNLVTDLITTIPGLDILVGLATNVMAVAGAFRLAAAAIQMFQGGRFAVQAAMSGLGRTRNMGDLGYLFGRGSAVDRAAAARGGSAGLSGAVIGADRERAAAARDAADADRRAAAAARNGATQISRMNTSMGTFVTATTPAMQRVQDQIHRRNQLPAYDVVSRQPVQTSAQRPGVGSRINSFVGGAGGWATLLSIVGLSTIGAISAETQNNMSKSDIEYQSYIRDVMLTRDDETQELIFVPKTTTQLANQISGNLKGSISWWDKLTTNPFETFAKTSDYTRPSLGVALKDMEGFLDAISYMEGLGPASSLLSLAGASYGDLNFKDVGKAHQALEAHGRNLAGMLWDEQIYSLYDLADVSKLSTDRLDELIDAMGPDFWDGLVANANQVGAEVGTEYNAENLSALADWIVNESPEWATARGANIVDPNTGTINALDYSTISSPEFLDSVTLKLRTNAEAAIGSSNAIIGWHQAIAAADEWAAAYGHTLDETNGILDLSLPAHQNLYGIMSSYAMSAHDRVATMKSENGTLREQYGQVLDNYEAFVQMAEGAGLSSSEIQRLAEEFNLLPEQWVSEIIAEVVNVEDLDELMDLLSILPPNTTVEVRADALTDDAIRRLELLGYEIEKVTAEDGTVTFKITAPELDPLKAEILSMDGTQVSINISALSEEAQAEIIEVAGLLDGLSKGETVKVDALTDEAIWALEALGISVEYNAQDDSFTVSADTGDAIDNVQMLKDEIQIGSTTLTVTIQYEEEPWTPTEGTHPELGKWGFDEPEWHPPMKPKVTIPQRRPDGSLVPQNQVPSSQIPRVYDQNNPSGGIRPGDQYIIPGSENPWAGNSFLDGINAALGKTPLLGTGPLPPITLPGGGLNGGLVDGQTLDSTSLEIAGWATGLGVNPKTSPTLPVSANTDPATESTNRWGLFAGGMSPIAQFLANANPATAASMGWFGMASSLLPSPFMTSNPSLAMAASMGWFGFAGGLFPSPLMTTNPALALALAMMWMRTTHGMRPVPTIMANAAPAFGVARQWFGYVSGMRPHARITASANTWAAESALNYAARNRVSYISVVTTGGGGGSKAEGGFTGRGGKYEVGGVYHRGEYIIPREHVNQATGRPNADALGRIFPGVRAPQPVPVAQNTGNGSGGIVELGPNSLHQLARRVVELQLDGSTIASNSSQHYARTTRRGSR